MGKGERLKASWNFTSFMDTVQSTVSLLFIILPLVIYLFIYKIFPNIFEFIYTFNFPLIPCSWAHNPPPIY